MSTQTYPELSGLSSLHADTELREKGGSDMSTQLTDNEIDRFNALYDKGCKLQKDLVILDGSPKRKPGFLGRRKLKESIQSFKEALAIHPASWPSMFFIGKAHQALGDLDSALSWFVKASKAEPENPSVAKEAGLCAARLDKHLAAIRFMKPAASANPGDAGLQCNIGLSYLMSEQVEEAIASFSQAVKADPGNKMNQRLLELAEAVAREEIPCPRSEAEILGSI
jgi:tetratricopeptide (TPR) repeat protein